MQAHPENTEHINNSHMEYFKLLTDGKECARSEMHHPLQSLRTLPLWNTYSTHSAPYNQECLIYWLILVLHIDVEAILISKQHSVKMSVCFIYLIFWSLGSRFGLNANSSTTPAAFPYPTISPSNRRFRKQYLQIRTLPILDDIINSCQSAMLACSC